MLTDLENGKEDQPMGPCYCQLKGNERDLQDSNDGWKKPNEFTHHKLAMSLLTEALM